MGPKLQERLARLGVHTLADLLFHLPLRYEDRTRVVAIGGLRAGMRVAVEGRVDLTEVKFGRRRTLLSRISDGTGAVTLRFFHFNAAQREMLARGTRVRCFGEARRGQATLELVHPEFRVLTAASDPAHEPGTSLTPVYPATEGVHQLTLRGLTDQALDRLRSGHIDLPELLPDSVLGRLALPPLAEAVAYVHRPPPDAPLELLDAGRHPAQRRLAFEELLAQQLSLRQLRHRTRRQAAPPLAGDGELRAAFLGRLPFALTAAQTRVAAEIGADLARATPMQRLVQGDVGSGKTVVAALAALTAVEAGFQTAVMAPTELLAEQHFRNFRHWLEPLGIELAWLSGAARTSARTQALRRIAGGEARVAVGTHALFQEGVQFEELGLVVVDEQHRFGVHQRLALREKGARDGRYPHQLIMTATPIPRTLAMTAYADLDNSVIDELPPGRTPVETVVVPENRRDAVVARVHQACSTGRQAYWVCTLIEQSEALQCQAAEEAAVQLREALGDLRVALVHGRMKPAEKERTMAAFQQGAIDLLVATTVIEVGVDVPNASLMVIENAERLGLAQLHQLRGRVGRGSAASACVLMYHGRLSAQARARLSVLRDTSDGFVIAARDLELRGPGELLGTRQTGMLQLRIADLQRDAELLPAVGRTADLLLERHADRVAPLLRRWIGERARYGQV